MPKCQTKTKETFRCVFCGQPVAEGDKEHQKQETLDHLRGWRSMWSDIVRISSDRKLVTKAKKAIAYIDEKLAGLDRA